MLSFNGTLIVQLVNFLVSWWILDRFFFRRCVAHVENERHDLRMLEHAVVDQKIEFEAIQKRQAESLKKFKSLFVKAVPSAMVGSSSKIVTSHAFVIPQLCDLSTQKMLADQTAAVLVKRITHV